MLEGKYSKKHFEEQDSKAPYVDALIMRLLPHYLIGVVARSTHLPSPRTLEIRKGPRSGSQAEICQAYLQCFLVFYQDVLRFEVPVHYVAGVDADEYVYQLAKDCLRLGFRKVLGRLRPHEIPEVS